MGRAGRRLHRALHAARGGRRSWRASFGPAFAGGQPYLSPWPHGLLTIEARPGAPSPTLAARTGGERAARGPAGAGGRGHPGVARRAWARHRWPGLRPRARARPHLPHLGRLILSGQPHADADPGRAGHGGAQSRSQATSRSMATAGPGCSRSSSPSEWPMRSAPSSRSPARSPTRAQSATLNRRAPHQRHLTMKGYSNVCWAMMRRSRERIDLAPADPPRSGCLPRALLELTGLGPRPTIVYGVSRASLHARARPAPHLRTTAID